MADAANLKIAVETAVHGALVDACQRISAEYGLQITDVYLEWAEKYDGATFEIRRIEVRTFARPEQVLPKEAST